MAIWWQKAKHIGYAIACFAWLFLVASPALFLWIVSLFSIRLDLRFGPMNPMLEVPGWTRNEFTYYLPKWRPF